MAIDYQLQRGRLVHRLSVAETRDGRYVEHVLDIAARDRGPQSVMELEQLVGQAREHIEQGRLDLVAKYRRDRHVGRPPPKPPAVDAETLQQLQTPS